MNRPFDVASIPRVFLKRVKMLIQFSEKRNRNSLCKTDSYKISSPESRHPDMHTCETRLNEYCSDKNDNKGKKRLEQEEIVGYRTDVQRGM